MTSLGIVIAVGEYTADAGNLPACRNDGAAIAHVLKSSGRFDDILHIDGDTTASSVKQKLANFAENHSEHEIDEVFFYFTGHGDFSGEEFYYLLTDYTSRKKKQTSLENAELDGIVRGLKPKLFIKIVDACHSGISYIKSPDDFQEFFKSAYQKFDKLYFMFSSQSEQFSYQNDKISYFTESIIKAIATHKSDKIRYKDIMSFVADDFLLRPTQTPLFVNQANFTEVLCDISEKMRSELMLYLQDEESSPKEAASPEEKNMTIVDRLREDAKRYCTKNEVLAILGKLAESARTFSLSDELKQIYSVTITEEKTIPPSPAAIGKWLDGSNSDNRYFARPTKEEEHYTKRVLKNTLMSMISSGYLDEGAYTYVNATRSVISGFSFSTEMPYYYIKIRLDSTFPNVAPEECYLTPIVSKTALRLFSAFSHFEYVDWDRSQPVGKLEWTTSEAPLKDAVAVQALLDQVIQRFWVFAEEPLSTTWGGEAKISETVENGGT